MLLRLDPHGQKLSKLACKYFVDKFPQQNRKVNLCFQCRCGYLHKTVRKIFRIQKRKIIRELFAVNKIIFTTPVKKFELMKHFLRYKETFHLLKFLLGQCRVDKPIPSHNLSEQLLKLEDRWTAQCVQYTVIAIGKKLLLSYCQTRVGNSLFGSFALCSFAQTREQIALVAL